MALVKRVQKKVIMSTKDIIKFQLITHCYLNKITVSNSDLECLTLLSSIGPIEISHFCYDAADEQKIFKSQQTVRNCINKCIKFKLVVRDGKNKKLIHLNSKLNIETLGSIFLDYNFLAK
tara:strand:+ start:649 stop:1008 length:360 start_codon:yes stop_codon:yes gene_type:complete